MNNFRLTSVTLKSDSIVQTVTKPMAESATYLATRWTTVSNLILDANLHLPKHLETGVHFKWDATVQSFWKLASD